MSINYDISANIIYHLHHLNYGELVYKIIPSVFQIQKLLLLRSSEALASYKNKQSVTDLKSVTDFVV